MIHSQEGIKPEWEDHQNFHGGKWTVNLDKKQRGNELDKIWLEAVGINNYYFIKP